jgi:hypothetical protein
LIFCFDRTKKKREVLAAELERYFGEILSCACGAIESGHRHHRVAA